MPAPISPTASGLRKRLSILASPEVAKSSAWFFKNGPGEYGEGDVFIGVKVPVLRRLAREGRGLAPKEIASLLRSRIHEERLLALLILVLQVERADDSQRRVAYELYLRNVRHVNNWDLVDSSAPAIVGSCLRDKSRKPLRKMARSANLWERRIAIVATRHFIRRGEFDDAIAVGELLLEDQEDLIHKATGWMLREVGQRDQARLVSFLRKHAATMPRTMLRYAIEHFSPAQRREFMAMKSARRGSQQAGGPTARSRTALR
jgi:3-methyladenine DNA glycosylase AlkD